MTACSVRLVVPVDGDSLVISRRLARHFRPPV